jgi:hypothetical protein
LEQAVPWRRPKLKQPGARAAAAPSTTSSFARWASEDRSWSPSSASPSGFTHRWACLSVAVSSPFSPCGRRWPREARSDEGSTHLSGGARRRSSEGWGGPLIRPPSAATFSRKGRRESCASSKRGRWSARAEDRHPDDGMCESANHRGGGSGCSPARLSLHPLQRIERWPLDSSARLNDRREPRSGCWTVSD